MTDTQALRDLLVKVAAGEYERDGKDQPKRYSEFRRDLDAAGVSVKYVPALMDALQKGGAKHAIRALIAQATP